LLVPTSRVKSKCVDLADAAETSRGLTSQLLNRPDTGPVSSILKGRNDCL